MILRKCLLLALFVSVVGSMLAADKNAPFKEGSLAQIQSQALESDQAYFIYFYAKDCRPCKKMNKSTWSDESLTKMIDENFLTLGIDALSSDYTLIQKYQVFDYPTLIFFQSDGTIMGRAQGFLAPQTLKTILSSHIATLSKAQKASVIAMKKKNKAKGIENHVDETKVGPTITREKGIMRPMDASPISIISSKKEESSKTSVEKHALLAEGQLNRGMSSNQAVQTQTKNTRSDDTHAVYRSSGVGYSQNLAVEKTEIQPLTNTISRGMSQSRIHLKLPEFEKYNLDALKARKMDDAFGLLVKTSTSFGDFETTVQKYERFWKGDIWAFAEEVNGTPVYKLVLGTYQSKDKAEIFANIIFKKEEINSTILDLNQLTR